MLMLPIGFDMLMLISQTYRIRCPDKLDNWPARDKAPVCLHGRKQTDKQTDNALGPKQTGHRYTERRALPVSLFPFFTDKRQEYSSLRETTSVQISIFDVDRNQIKKLYIYSRGKSCSLNDAHVQIK